MLNAYELEVISKADAVLGAPKQLELRVPGWAPGAADKPIGYEEPCTPEMEEMSKLAGSRLEATLAELAATNAQLHTARAAAVARGEADPFEGRLGFNTASTPEELGAMMQRENDAKARRAANPPPAPVVQLAERLAAGNQMTSQERQAVMNDMVDALEASGLSLGDATEDAEQLAFDATLRGFSENFFSMFDKPGGMPSPAGAATRPRAASTFTDFAAAPCRRAAHVRGAPGSSSAAPRVTRCTTVE
jgi:hypothetical protein